MSVLGQSCCLNCGKWYWIKEHHICPPYARPASANPPDMREFETGATRNIDTNRLDFEGFLSPSALTRFAEFMHKNRVQADGKLRASDNWQKGMPRDTYMKSMFRHFMELWTLHRSSEVVLEAQEEALCALWFNVQGYLHETIALRKSKQADNSAS